MKLFFVFFSFFFFVQSAGAAPVCRVIFPNVSGLIMGFNSQVTQTVTGLKTQARIKFRVENKDGFNNQILQSDVTRIEKLVRQETPYTVSLMGREVVEDAPGLSRFNQIGLVVGDPHFGNFNTQPVVFRNQKADRNSYTISDLDEVTLGVFSLDFVRYIIFLKASFGDLNLKFGRDFEEKLFEEYARGLRNETIKTPHFVEKAIQATSLQIREKLDRYASNLVNSEGQFRRSLFGQKQLLEFTTKNMKAQFLEKMAFDRRNGDRKEFKSAIWELMEKAAQSELGEKVQVLDIAIPIRDSGGSATMQRFLLSTKVEFEGKSYHMILEFKQNTDKAAWDAVIESRPLTPAERYSLALQATTDDPGPFQKIVKFNSNLSFLMRPKGNLDVDFKGLEQTRELALFNAHFMGRFHGGQGSAVSGAYVREVSSALQGFKETMIAIADKVLNRLYEESGLKPPRP